MAKNGPIDPNFGHILYLWDFYDFSKFWPNRPFFGWFLAKKPLFMLNRHKLKNVKLTLKIINVNKFSPLWSNFYYKGSLIHLKEVLGWTSWYFHFLWFYVTRKLPKGHFFGDFDQKTLFRKLSGPIKSQKMKISTCPSQ